MKIELKNGRMRACVLDYGATLQSLRFDGAEVVLGYDDETAYRTEAGYLGATVGRVANRIAGGQFTLHGKTYTLDCNEGDTHLHGGKNGISNRVWEIAAREEASVCLCTTDEGDYPGRASIEAEYILGEKELTILYRVRCDEDSPVSIANHAYFNLAGEGDILDTELYLNADAFTPVDPKLLPTGEIRSVTGTPFDFRTPTAIGARIGERDEQLSYGGGYDHNYCLSGGAPFCTAFSPKSGILMTGYTTEPAVQLYTGNQLGSKYYGKNAGFCLETQYYPDSPHHPEFPNCIVKAGQTRESRTTFRFERKF